MYSISDVKETEKSLRTDFNNLAFDFNLVSSGQVARW